MSKVKSRQVDMIHGSLWKKIIIFAIPIALTNLVQQLFNSADVAVVGRFAGSDAIAAVGANAPVINLIVNLFFGLSVGANVFVAENLGRGEKETVNKAAHTSVLVALISGLIITAVGVTLAPAMLKLIAVPENVIDMAVTYLRIYFAGMPFIMLYYFENAIFRSMGDTRTPLIVLVISGVINIGLNFMFVAGFGMDVDGVAIATVISNVISAVVLFIMLCRRDDEFKLEFGRFRIHGFILKKLIAIGIPAGLQGAVFSISNVVVQSAINSLGSNAVAATTTSVYFEMYSYCFANAFGHAATTFAGQNWGAGDFARCRKATRICLILGIASSGLAGGLFALFAGPSASIYTTSTAVIELAVIRMHTVTALMWLNTTDDVLVASLRVYGRTIMPTVIYMVSICGVRLAWIYTVFQAHRDMWTISVIYPISWMVANVLLIAAYLIVLRNMKKQMAAAA